MKHTITFYNSFEEQKEAEAKYAASLSPIECLQQGITLIKKMYPIGKRNKSRRINFVKTS